MKIEGLDINNHGGFCTSIMDLNNDLNISQHKWDFLFEFLLKEASNFYFSGYRFNFTDDELDETINYLSEKVFIDKNKHGDILFKLKSHSLLFNRRLLAKLWDYYEFPTIFFLKDNYDEDWLVTLCDNGVVFDDICKTLEGIYIVSRSFELNVLWIRKSNDMHSLFSGCS